MLVLELGFDFFALPSALALALYSALDLNLGLDLILGLIGLSLDRHLLVTIQ